MRDARDLDKLSLQKKVITVFKWVYHRTCRDQSGNCNLIFFLNQTLHLTTSKENVIVKTW